MNTKSIKGLFVALAMSVLVHGQGIRTYAPGIHVINSGSSLPAYLDEIIVQSGAKLTIDNRDIAFASTTGKITVEPGGQLLVISSQLEPTPGNTWAGITLLGAGSTVAQDPVSVGSVELQGATILKAEIGIQVGTSAINSGGIVTTHASKFLNCKYGIIFRPYTHPVDNKSVLSYTDFIWDGGYPASFFNINKAVTADGKYYGNLEDGEPGEIIRDPDPVKNPDLTKHFMVHLAMHQTKGIKIRSCSFRNQKWFKDWGFIQEGDVKRSYCVPQKRGTGIHADRASFHLYKAGPCYHLDPNNPNNNNDCVECHGTQNVFEGLYAGVKFRNLSGAPFAFNTNITGSLFINSTCGVFAGDEWFDLSHPAYTVLQGEISGIFIKHNEFIWNDALFYYLQWPDEYSSGINLFQAKDYKIIDNRFSFKFTPSSDPDITNGQIACPMNYMGSTNRASIYLKNNNHGGDNVIFSNYFDSDGWWNCSYSYADVLFKNYNEIDLFNCNRFYAAQAGATPSASTRLFNIYFESDGAFEDLEHFPTQLGSPTQGLRNEFYSGPFDYNGGFGHFTQLGFEDMGNADVQWKNDGGTIRYYGYNGSAYPYSIFNNDDNVNMEVIPVSTGPLCASYTDVWADCGYYSQGEEVNVPPAPPSHGNVPTWDNPNMDIVYGPNPVNLDDKLSVKYTWEEGVIWYTVTIYDENFQPIPFAGGTTLYTNPDQILVGFPCFDPPCIYYIRIINNLGRWEIFKVIVI